MFNTPKEDCKVARVLSGWSPDDKPLTVDAAKLDSSARASLTRLQSLVFGACSGHADRRLNVDSKVLDALTATLVLHYPQLKVLNEHAPAVRHLETCALEARITTVELLSWSTALHQSATAANDTKHSADERDRGGTVCDRDTAVINELIAINRKLSARLRVCETALLRLPAQQERKRTRDDDCGDEPTALEAPPPKRRKKSAPANLSSVWYAWYTQVPRMWNCGGDRQRRSDSRLLVAYLKLFLPKGFELDEADAAYKDTVLAHGKSAESALLEFLRSRSFTATGFGTVLKEMRRIHRAGELDDRIDEYRLLLRTERIVDPAPLASQDILAPARTPAP